jgi:hypothetical protein
LNILFGYIKNPQKRNCNFISLGGIKCNPIPHYLIGWFWQTHHFLNMLYIHIPPLGTHWWKKKLDNWLVSNGGFLIFDSPNNFYLIHQVLFLPTSFWNFRVHLNLSLILPNLWEIYEEPNLISFWKFQCCWFWVISKEKNWEKMGENNKKNWNALLGIFNMLKKNARFYMIFSIFEIPKKMN